MRIRIFTYLAACLVLCSSTRADIPTRWSGTSEITFSGTSTLHSWSGKVSADPFVATVMMSPEGLPLSLKAKVEVKAADMNTAEPKRDVNMHNDMNVTKFPLITGAIDTSFDKLLSGRKIPSKLPFTLTILGKPQEVEATISNWANKGDQATFDLDFELSLKKCGITVPSVLLFISVGDAIKIHAPVKLVRSLKK